MKHVILDRKKHTFFILLLFLLPSVLAVTARGEENDFPPFGWEEEGDLLPPFSYTEENAGENWNDWEEDWSITWNDPEGEGSFPSWDPWEEWEEGGQEEPPSWGPEEDPEEGPAFPEEEPEEGSSPASSSSSSSSSSKAPKSSASSKTSQKKTTQKSKEKVESSGEGNSETNQPAVLPRRVTENDIPRKAPPLWYRGTDPNILWILLVALSLIILGLRILWNQGDDTQKRRTHRLYDDHDDYE